MPPFRYFIPSAITASSLLLGLYSVVASVEGDFRLAAWLVLWGVLLDKLDGTAARLLRATSTFGMELDSFADFVVFGVAPGALVYFRLRALGDDAGAPKAILLAASGLYVVSLACRLARFNITTSEDDTVFRGIPGTLMGAIVAASFLTWDKYALPETWLRGFPVLLVAGAILMISTLPLPKLKVRKNLAFNLFQFANVIAAYICAPLRLFPEYLLGTALVYTIGGVLWGLTHPVTRPSVPASSAT